jgi:signal transduction histidine kinase
LQNVFSHLKQFTEFGPADERGLRALHEHARPHLAAVADGFYARILGDESARAVLQAGETRVGRLRETLQSWLELLLSGPWDEAYYQQRCAIGRVHVRIQLPQHLMFGAMNFLRSRLGAIADDAPVDEASRREMRTALGRILDLELAIMLHTYREELEANQARAERLATFGQLVGSIGHELRNPLGVMETSLYILRSRLGEDERAKKHADRIGEQLQIAAGIISDLLEMIRERPLQRERLGLRGLLESAVQQVPSEGTRVAIEGAEALEVEGDAGQLRLAFVNLLQNAYEAAGPKGTVEIHASGGDQLRVSVEDSGPGVSDEVERRLFEPLITTRPKGIGLGLALVRRIVERHGGVVAHEPHLPGGPGLGGARFLVMLPSVRA